MNNKILVTGVTGNQGAAVAKELLAQGYTVRGLVRKENEQTDLLKTEIEIAIGSFDDAESLQKAFEGIDKVVLSFPLLFDETVLMQYAKNIVMAWKNSEVSMFVFNTNLPVYKEKVGLVAFDSKLTIEQYFDVEKLPYISLRPTLYLDNLSAPFLLPVVQANNILPYPVPDNEKIAWLSHQDLAKFIVEALKHNTLIGKKFFIGGQLITGEEMAATISKLAGRHIQFIPVSPDDFERQIAPAFGEHTAKEIANIYRFVKDNVEHLQAKDLQENTLINLPIVLQNFEEWASRVEW
jgi:NAD(P)H dehydrogenase (quinone)